MGFIDAMILAVVQGLTEFLPVSSSAHLVLVKALLGVHTEGVVWEVALHVGTLVAVVIFLRSELWRVITGFFSGLTAILTGMDRATAWKEKPDFRLACYVILGTIPAGLIGVLLHKPIERLFESPIPSAAMLFLTGEILWLTRPHSLLKSTREVTWKDSLWIGLGQALAVLPGISRSGTTIAAGLLRDVNREQAARFSFLLSIPVILGAALLDARKVAALPNGELSTLGIAVGVAAVVGYVALRVLLRVVKAGRLHYFSYYCWAASVAAVSYFWFLGSR